MSSSSERRAAASASARRAASVSRSIGLRATAASTCCESCPTPTTTGERGSIVILSALGVPPGRSGPVCWSTPAAPPIRSAPPASPAHCSAHLFGSPARSSASRWDRYPPPDARSCRNLLGDAVDAAAAVGEDRTRNRYDLSAGKLFGDDRE